MVRGGKGETSGRDASDKGFGGSPVGVGRGLGSTAVRAGGGGREAGSPSAPSYGTVSVRTFACVTESLCVLSVSVCVLSVSVCVCAPECACGRFLICWCDCYGVLSEARSLIISWPFVATYET